MGSSSNDTVCTPLAPTRNKIIYKTACSDEPNSGSGKLLKTGFAQKRPPLNMSPAIQFHPIILCSHILSPNFLRMTQVDQSWDCFTINDQRNWGGPLLGVQGQCFTAPKMRFCSDPTPSIIARDPTRLRDPKTQRPGCFLMRTLPFGSEASVLHFNCTARLLH